DGTRLVGLAVRSSNTRSRVIEWIEVREIRVRVGRTGHRSHELRLWTSLIDPAAAPELEIARVYAHRWEHELYFRELTRQLRRTSLLQSHTVDTGARNRRARVGQCRLGDRTRAGGERHDLALADQLRSAAGHRAGDVAGPGPLRRYLHRSAEDPGRAPWPRAHAPHLDRASTAAHLSTRRSTTHHPLAAA